jgi:DUF2934 family protein
MNRTTLSTLAETQPPEPLLEHEIRLRAYDLYEQQGRMDGHSVADWLHAESSLAASPEAPDRFASCRCPRCRNLAEY